MTKQVSSGPPGQDDRDPWAAFGYLVAGVGFYGFLGWVLGRWLHAAYLVAVGIVVGLAFGMYLVFARYRFRGDGKDGTNPSPPPIENDGSRDGETGCDDRGETQ